MSENRKKPSLPPSGPKVFVQQSSRHFETITFEEAMAQSQGKGLMLLSIPDMTPPGWDEIAGIAASKGREREAFIHFFLSQILPSIPQFGCGDITDCNGQNTQEGEGKSGQLDIVIECPFLPSLPSLGMRRLYLAESVAAVIEVKSDVASQWDEVQRTAMKVKQLRLMGRSWWLW
jgi:hypothetical protein